jgi:SpoVK/Ycf46/Vps4 family AAA+-type ATPase
MLLSVIGGNKDVSNLVFMTSTNYLKKVDEAILRRLSGHYQVGRPNPDARTKILLKKLNYFKGKDALLNHTIKITTNFTGAAMNNLGNSLLQSLKIKKMNNKPQEL